MNVNLQMFAIYNLKIQTGHITEIYLHAGVALSPALPTYRYLQSVVKPEPQLLCMRPSASLWSVSLQWKCVSTSLDSVRSCPLSLLFIWYLWVVHVHRIYRKKTRFWICICNEKVLSPAPTKTFIQQFDRLLQFYL